MALMARRTITRIYLSTGMVVALAGLAWLAEERVALGPTDGRGFRPIRWPFPVDAWPPGRAWTGHDLDVYVRLKSADCSDCGTGLITDEAVDRLVDIERLDPRFVADGPGNRIRITDLFGRSRLYRHKMHNGALRLAEGIAVAYKCDLVVALVDGNMADLEKRKMAHRFLESNTVQVWVNKQLEERR